MTVGGTKQNLCLCAKSIRHVYSTVIFWSVLYFVCTLLPAANSEQSLFTQMRTPWLCSVQQLSSMRRTVTLGSCDRAVSCVAFYNRRY